jgi:hypothetical protein
MNFANARFARFGALSLTAATMSLAISATLASTAAADGPGVGSPWMVTVGDSLASGEGGRWAGNTLEESWRTDRLGPTAYGEPTAEAIPGCHRSKVATAQDAIAGVQTKNFACSGAKTFSQITSDGKFKPGLDDPNIVKAYRSQTHELQAWAATHNVKAVVVTIGANNYGFDEVLARCVWNFMNSTQLWRNYCKDDSDMTSRFTAARRATETTNVKNALLNIRTAMSNAGYSTAQYSIIARTYWSPIPEAARFRYAEASVRLDTGGCGFWNGDADWANGPVIGAVNSTIKDAVAQSGLPNIKIVDQQKMLVGRRLCELGVGLIGAKSVASWSSPGAVDATEWVARIRTGDDGPYSKQESAHASFWGQMAMRSCLRQAFNGGAPRGGECVRVANGLNAIGEPQMELR